MISSQHLRAAALLLGVCGLAAAQSPAPPSQPAVQPPKPDTHMTRRQAKELFSSVDQILKFDSGDTGLAIKQEVKRRLTTRDAVEKFLVQKMNEDKDTKRMERSEIVLEKFGLLDRGFALRPFLLGLLKEQIAGFYDNKTKTVNLLDWIEPDTQKPVLAHELTHALQDQRVDLETWGNKSVEGIAQNAAEDTRHLATDETDTAREAVLEGQAMVTYLDYGLLPTGQSLLTYPDLIQKVNDSPAADDDSPLLEHAPLVLQESLLFPYRDGLTFEATLLKEKGIGAAFAGTLDRPPDSSWEIMNPHAYERGQKVTRLRMPDVHPLLDQDYSPYDIGVMGELDVKMLGEALADKGAGADAALGWDGGLYYAAQARTAKTDAEQAKTGSVALMYLSQWKTPEAAASFAKLYAGGLRKKYTKVERDAASAGAEEVYSTEEGPVLIATAGREVFVSESFPLPLARKLEALMTSAQLDGDRARSLRRLNAGVDRPLGPLVRQLRADEGRPDAACSGRRAGILKFRLRAGFQRRSEQVCSRQRSALSAGAGCTQCPG